MTPGHGATITSATIEDKALIGINAVVSEGALVETGAQLAAGSVVPPGRRIPAGEVSQWTRRREKWLVLHRARPRLTDRHPIQLNQTYETRLKQLWGGNPVKFIRKLDDDEIIANTKAAEQYHALAGEHANEFQPFGAAYLDAEKAKTA